jgi:hypothetical protein
MSNFYRQTKNPKTGQIEQAEWLDDYFGSRKYGVRFPDGMVYRPEEVEDDNAEEALARYKEMK